VTGTLVHLNVKNYITFTATIIIKTLRHTASQVIPHHFLISFFTLFLDNMMQNLGVHHGGEAEETDIPL